VGYGGRALKELLGSGEAAQINGHSTTSRRRLGEGAEIPAAGRNNHLLKHKERSGILEKPENGIPCK